MDEYQLGKLGSEVYVVMLIKKLDRAALVELEEGEEIWLPYSQVPLLKELEEGWSEFDITCPNWILMEKDMHKYVDGWYGLEQ